MKTLFKSFVMIVLLGGLAACVEDDAYVSDYYSNGGYFNSYNSNDMTSGYNRDYQGARHSGKRQNPDPSTYEHTNKNPDAPDVGYQRKVDY